MDPEHLVLPLIEIAVWNALHRGMDIRLVRLLFCLVLLASCSLLFVLDGELLEVALPGRCQVVDVVSVEFLV